MKLNRNSRRSPGMPGGLAVSAILVLGSLSWAGVPRIDHAEIVNAGSSKIITVHFDTEAYRSYTLQRCTSFIQTSNGVTAVWSNIDFAPPNPYNSHWVGVDLLPVAPGTNLPVRFYRLMVDP